MSTAQQEPLEVNINGEATRVEAGTTITQLIAQRNPGAACAVEVNKQLVPHRTHAQRIIQQGDRIEIVSLVGGG